MELTAYEKKQQFNALAAWLHSRRYSRIIREFTSLNLGRRIKIAEIGCAHAKLFGVLNQICAIDYTGIDTNDAHLTTARERYGAQKNFRVIHESALSAISRIDADIVVALETLEHIPEHEVVRLVENVAATRPSKFIVSVPIEIGPSIWLKNVGSFLCGYRRWKEYTWSETFYAGLYNLDRVRVHETSHTGFDWRWLAQTIRHNFRIESLRTLPLSFLPAAVSSSIFIVATPRR